VTNATPEKEFLDKLERVVDDVLAQRVIHFTPEEARLLKRVAARERAWTAIGALAGSLKTILTWMGFMIGAWIFFKAGVLQWISENLK
jgi:uncharacterized membrane protein